MSYDPDFAKKYLETGGLGEVIGFTSLAADQKQPKVQMDTDMAMALCLLADEALKRSQCQLSDAQMSEPTRRDIANAMTWRRGHWRHVAGLVISATAAHPPSGSDCGRPELWKGEHWKWLMRHDGC